MKTLTIAILLLIATGVNAQTTTLPLRGDSIQRKMQDVQHMIGTKVEENRERIQLHRDDIAEQVEEHRKERRIKLQEHRQDKVKNLTNRIGEHLEIVIQRFENIVERFDSRLSKMEEKNIDISDTENALDKAKESIESLKTVISGVKSNIDTILEGEFSREEIHTEIDIAKNAIKNTREMITNALNTFKASVKIDTIEE